MTFKDRLRRHRRAKGWTQCDLARELRVSRATVQRWETGGDAPDASTVIRMAALFGVSAHYLLGFRDTPDRGYFLTPDEAIILEGYRVANAEGKAWALRLATDRVRAEELMTGKRVPEPIG